MNSLREQFEHKIHQLNEDAGRGRGTAGGFVTAKKGFEAFIKSVNYDYLNRSTHLPFGMIEKYNFNNYYTLDIRINIDKLLTAWESGFGDYSRIFERAYNAEGGDYAKNMKECLYFAYVDYYEDLKNKKIKNGKSLEKTKMVGTGKDRRNMIVSTIEAPEPLSLENHMESPLEDLLKTSEMKYVYDTLPAISIYTDEVNQEQLGIKNEGFVTLIMDGLKSAARGHVPQGVTIEEILQGKFSRKAIAPEQGTFINRVKDPTSDKSFDFRAMDIEVLESLHTLIMQTFKTSTELRNPIPEVKAPVDGGEISEANESEESPEAPIDPKATTMLGGKVSSLDQLGARSITRSELFLYMTQDDFHKLEKGGKGFSNVVKSIVKDIGTVNAIPDF